MIAGNGFASIKRIFISMEHTCNNRKTGNSISLPKTSKFHNRNQVDEFKHENNERIMQNIRRKLAIITVASNNTNNNPKIRYFYK